MANAYQISFLKPLALARTEADKFVMLVDCKNLNLDKLPQLLHRIYDKQDIRIELDDALKDEEIKVYYQPIYDAWTREIIGAEALVRWHSPKTGVILPEKFIPVLEESGHITKLDIFVYKHVQEIQEQRSAAGQKVVRITVNLSRMDLMDETFMNQILDDVHSKQQLKEAGVNILIDDFGNGASSFSTIRDTV